MPVLPPKGPYVPLGGTWLFVEGIRASALWKGQWGQASGVGEVPSVGWGWNCSKSAIISHHECACGRTMSIFRKTADGDSCWSSLFPEKWHVLVWVVWWGFWVRTKATKLLMCPRPWSSSWDSPSSNLTPLFPAVCPCASGKTSLSLSPHLKNGNRSICLPGLDKRVC